MKLNFLSSACKCTITKIINRPYCGKSTVTIFNTGFYNRVKYYRYLYGTKKLFSNLTNDKIIVKVPQMGDSITEGTLNRWSKKLGEQVQKDDVVGIIDTDKISVDILAPNTGKITQFLANPGDIVAVGASILEISLNDIEPVEKISNPDNIKESTNKEEIIDKKDDIFITKEGIEYKTETDSALRPTGTVSQYSSDYLNDIDIKKHNRSETRQPMSRMRQRIAERLKGAQNVMAMLTTFTECDMSNLLDLKSKYSTEFTKIHGIKFGMMSTFVKACTVSLKKMPEVNTYIIEDPGERQGIILSTRDYVDISVAVATPNGLVVPVIRDCDKKEIWEIEKELAIMAEKARKGNITLEDMSGGSMTITNGGVFGSLFSTPIINPPQSCILGMHSISDKPVACTNPTSGKKEVVIKPIMYLALTYDHRLIDGREAVLFLKNIKQCIEKPEVLLLGLP
ncbi:dihydrolipoamide succinyltransferase component of 2-oxoglutaratedehydrogenase complex [Cryptosporidium andersoni]|uniref:dihydrolipoyllysine-residue succinyltransferase n=1 Tax=Cryptosporidium andersoni TaxID=117008 RepID=A0A1J4MGY7_9CRYT|nr:dihydrolipoamide succinyltransferase component of 2-oxoglutaratedehydrogenase complex [Cryptosporidium andersoni]